jgi:hypothetical protein
MKSEKFVFCGLLLKHAFPPHWSIAWILPWLVNMVYFFLPEVANNILVPLKISTQL